MRKTFVGMLILALAVVLAFGLSACGGKDDTGGKGGFGGGPGKADLSEVPESLLSLRDVAEVPDEPTNGDLIEAAYEAGDISEGEYAALQLRADVAYDTLPEEYKSGAVAGRDDSLMIQYALEH